MTKIHRLLCAMALAFVAASCAHSPLQPALACGARLVADVDRQRIETDLAAFDTAGEGDILHWAETDGFDFVVCVVNWYVTHGTAEQKAAAKKLKAGHVEFRNAG